MQYMSIQGTHTLLKREICAVEVLIYCMLAVRLKKMKTVIKKIMI
jgi:hypothetical protein